MIITKNNTNTSVITNKIKIIIKKPIDEGGVFCYRYIKTWRRNAKIVNTRLVIILPSPPPKEITDTTHNTCDVESKVNTYNNDNNMY